MESFHCDGHVHSPCFIQLINNYAHCTEIAVRFSRGHYEATEISGMMEVEIILVRGTSTVPVGVTVTMRSGSATGLLTFDYLFSN